MMDNHQCANTGGRFLLKNVHRTTSQNSVDQQIEEEKCHADLNSGISDHEIGNTGQHLVGFFRLRKLVYNNRIVLACFHTLLLLCLSASLPVAEGGVIWRCPDFNLLQCKNLPSTCVSFRMIYIRHGDLECPGCLICADPSRIVPWTSLSSDIYSENDQSPKSGNEKVGRKKRRKLRERERKRREKKREKRQRQRERNEKKRQRKKLKKLKRMHRKQKKSNEIMAEESS